MEIYSSAATTLGNVFANSARALQSMISEILIPQRQTATNILGSSLVCLFSDIFITFLLIPP